MVNNSRRPRFKESHPLRLKAEGEFRLKAQVELRCRTAEHEISAVCARYKVALVYEQGESTATGKFARFFCVPAAPVPPVESEPVTP